MLDYENTLQEMLVGDIDALTSSLVGLEDVNVATDNDQWNLLHYALVPLHANVPTSVLALLATRGVDVNAKDSFGNTPLHYAARKHDAAAIACLVSFDADCNSLNLEGDSPLILSLYDGPTDLASVEGLLRGGADPDAGISGSARKLVDGAVFPEKDDVITLFEKYS